MVEGARLESVCAGNRTVGSNPILSARRKTIFMSLRISGQELVSPPSDLVIATDASFVEKGRLHSGGFIGTDGSWGVEAGAFIRDPCRGDCVTVSELRAIWFGLRKVSSEQAVTILTDSQGACDYISRWQEGGTSFPAAYSLRPRGYLHEDGLPTLQLLQQKVQGSQRLTVEWVKGHNGHPLNEAADSLAGIGINALREVYDENEASRRAGSLVTSFLLSYKPDFS